VLSEYEQSSALAYTLEGSRVYDVELKSLFSGDFRIVKDTAYFQDGRFFIGLYRRGPRPSRKCAVFSSNTWKRKGAEDQNLRGSNQSNESGVFTLKVDKWR
jgi:hypothetical protein